MKSNRLLLAALTLAVAPSGVAAQQTYETTRIADGIYRFRYQFHNGMFVVTDDGVVVLDPITVDAARALTGEIRRLVPGVTLAAVVYSHSHQDHASGANVLLEAFGPAPVVSHVNARVEIVAAAAPDQPVPTITFTERLTLHFGGREIQLYYLGPNHSDNSIVAIVPDSRVAFAVDFVSHDRVGFRDLASFDMAGQIVSLERLAQLDFETIVLGHGERGNKASVGRQIEYYRDLMTAVESAINRGLSEDQAAASISLDEYASWGGYADWFELNVRGMYRWAVDH
ncbi:MAG: MBL fold metallo-hydrolase [Gemmatimonadales bacterium]